MNFCHYIVRQKIWKNITKNSILARLCRAMSPRSYAVFWHNSFNLHTFRPYLISLPGVRSLFLKRVQQPLSKAMLAVIVLYYGVATWNSWFWASAILRDRKMYPLQVVLREILLNNSISGMAADTGVGDVESIAMSIKYATIMVATVPILCVYPFLQKYFTSGVMTGAVKE